MPEPQSKLVTIRMSNTMIAAWKAAAAAAGISKSLWLRKLIEREVGVDAAMSKGMGGMNDEQRAARLATYRKTMAEKKKATKKS